MSDLHLPIVRASRLITLIGMTLLLAASVSCSMTTGPGRSGEELELLRNRQRWASAGIHDYEFEFRRTCFCLPDATEPVRITVRNDVVTSVIRTRDGQPASTNVRTWPTVDSLFTEVRRQIDQSAERLEVEYDASYGYPRSMAVDVRATMADDEFWISATNLRRLP